MTIEFKTTTKCEHCGEHTPTEEWWKHWIRSHNDLDSRKACLSIGDSDLWVLRYGTRRHNSGVDRDVQYLMMVEVKTRGGDLSDSQRDLLVMVNDLIRTNPWKEQRDVGKFIPTHDQNVRRIKSWIAKRAVDVYCYGAHVLRMSGTTPVDSEWMLWDNRIITSDQLVGLLRYDLHPDSLRPMEHRMHKPVYEPPPSLFEF